MASYDSENEYWEDAEFQTVIAGHLVGVRPSALLPWTNALRPVKDHLTNALSTIYRNREAGEQVRSFATDTLADYWSDNPNGLFGLLANANEKQFGPIFEKLDPHREQAVALGNAEVAKAVAEDASEDDKEALAKRQANAAVMLLRMDASDQVWPLLKHSSDPRVRSYIIHWLSPRGGDPQTISSHYEQETDVTIKRALLLCLGEFELDEPRQQPLIETLLTVYRSDHDAGLHAAAEWLLRQWKQGEQLGTIEKQLQQKEEQLAAAKDKQRQWYINMQGQTFVILDAGEFQMGSPQTEALRNPNEQLHKRKIGRRFAIGTKEVTRGQWRAFLRSADAISVDDPAVSPNVRSTDAPMVAMTWYEAAWYCNWLSEQEGIPEEQWCYLPNDQGKFGPGMKAKGNIGELTGYRLPTEAEWEFACRAGASSSRYYGSSESLLSNYARYQANGESHVWSVGSLKPNDLGLFDMLGNAYEWCHDTYAPYPSSHKETSTDQPKTNVLSDTSRLVLRGGSFYELPANVRSALRTNDQPEIRDSSDGFRPARTFPYTP